MKHGLIYSVFAVFLLVKSSESFSMDLANRLEVLAIKPHPRLKAPNFKEGDDIPWSSITKCKVGMSFPLRSPENGDTVRVVDVVDDSGHWTLRVMEDLLFGHVLGDLLLKPAEGRTVTPETSGALRVFRKRVEGCVKHRERDMSEVDKEKARGRLCFRFSRDSGKVEYLDLNLSGFSLSFEGGPLPFSIRFARDHLNEITDREKFPPWCPSSRVSIQDRPREEVSHIQNNNASSSCSSWVVNHEGILSKRTIPGGQPPKMSSNLDPTPLPPENRAPFEQTVVLGEDTIRVTRRERDGQSTSRTIPCKTEAIDRKGEGFYAVEMKVSFKSGEREYWCKSGPIFYEDIEVEGADVPDSWSGRYFQHAKRHLVKSIEEFFTDHAHEVFIF